MDPFLGTIMNDEISLMISLGRLFLNVNNNAYVCLRNFSILVTHLSVNGPTPVFEILLHLLRIFTKGFSFGSSFFVFFPPVRTFVNMPMQ